MTGDTAGAEPLPSYADALDELDTILDELETGDADIDVLAARVERAATLVRLCRARLDDARMEVTRIVADLDAGSGVAPAVDATPGTEPGGDGNLTP